MNSKLIILWGVIRTIIIQLLIFFVVSVSFIDSYVVIAIPFYIAVDYLALKYGLIKLLDNNNLSTKENVLLISLLLFIFNFIIFIFRNLAFYIVLVYSLIPCIIIRFINSNIDKNKKIEYDTKKAIDEYFSNRKED